MPKPHITWQPQPGPQQVLLACPIREICYGGARGGGKTDGMLGHFARHVQLYGEHAQGIFFRRRYKQLDRVKFRGKQIFGAMGAKFIESKESYEFRFPNGATLKLRHLEKNEDADEYQGHEYNWMCFEELTQWPTPTLIDKMRAVSRDSNGIPCYFLSTCNPGGPGHGWVKSRYILPAPSGYKKITIKAQVDQTVGVVHVGHKVLEREGIFIPATVYDNRKLLDSTPEYIDNLYLSGPAWLVKAWLDGDWDILAGGFLEGIWNPAKHIVESFTIPPTWPRWRAVDWGFKKPFSMGYYTRSPDDGVIYRYKELYGWGGGENIGSQQDALQVKRMMWDFERIEREAGCEFKHNPGGVDMWSRIGTISSVNDIFRSEPIRIETGEMMDWKVNWTKADAGPGSRAMLNNIVITLLKHDRVKIFRQECPHFLRTVPIIPSDEDNPEDVDSEAEDHAWDEFKMALGSRRKYYEHLQDETDQGDPAERLTMNFLEKMQNGRNGKFTLPRPA